MTKKALAATVSLTSGLLLLLATIYGSLPSNVLSDTGIKSAARFFSVDLAPQGWAFFTRDPSEADLLYYDAASLEPLWITPQGRAENGFGVSRTQRAQGPEAAELLQSLGIDDWHECDAGAKVVDCVLAGESDLRDRIQVTNNTPVKTLCGNVLFVQADPVPWSYREFYEETHLPRYVAGLEVEC